MTDASTLIMEHLSSFRLVRFAAATWRGSQECAFPLKERKFMMVFL